MRRFPGAVLVGALLLAHVLVGPALGAPAAVRAGTSALAEHGRASDPGDQMVPGLVDLVSPLRDGRGEEVGTGLVLSSSGLVLTNAHVVADSARTRARDVDTGEVYPARVVAKDAEHDLAVLQMQDADDLAVAPIGTSTGLRRGDPVAAVGNAGGGNGDPVVTTGTITALGRSITATDDDGANPENLTGLIQVSARVRPGDSGGALVDRNGRVIGITTASGRGAGFAIPVDQALAWVHVVTGAGARDAPSEDTDAGAADRPATEEPG